MKRLFLLFIGLCLGTLQLFSQSLEEQTAYQIQSIKKMLYLDAEETEKVKKVLTRYNVYLEDLIKRKSGTDSSFQLGYKILKSERDKGLAEILSSEQMILFQVNDQQQLNGIKHYFSKLIESLEVHPDLMDELAVAFYRKQVPLILHHKNALDQHITSRDSFNLVILGQKFNEIMELALEKANREKRSFINSKIIILVKYIEEEYPEARMFWKKIRRLSDKYEGHVKTIYQQLNAQTPKWNEELKTIIQKYHTLGQKDRVNQLFSALELFGANDEINQLVFLLFDEGDINSYFRLNEITRKIFVRKAI